MTDETKITAKILFTCKVALEENLADKKLLKGIIKETIRKYGDTKKMRMSKAAKELHPDEDLTLSRNEAKIKSYSDLWYEHKDTVHETLNKILRSNTVNEIEKILEATEIAWVTREENNRLSAHGFNSTRPNSDEAYRLCGIELL